MNNLVGMAVLGGILAVALTWIGSVLLLEFLMWLTKKR